MTRPERLVWYVAYGSNLCRSRFDRYLTGGPVAQTPNAHAEEGARDPTPPRDEWSGPLDIGLYFAWSSVRWGGGGVAFIDPNPATGVTALVRAYLVTAGQFEDIARQENRQPTPSPVDFDALEAHGHLDLYPERLYGRAVYLGSHDDGRPMVSFTAAEPPELNQPHPSYMATIAEGLREALALTDDAIARYLAAAPGVEQAIWT